MEIFKLFGSIMVDSAEADKSIHKTSEEAEGLGQKLKGGMEKAAKWGAAIAGAAVAAGSALMAAAKGTAEDLDVIDKASIRMGITAEQYQELAYAAGLSGVNMTVMEKAAKKLEGTDLNMQDAIDQLMAISDESERSQAAIDLFGESVAYQMTPLLQAGSEGMQQMRTEAHDLGLIMSGEAVSNGAAMNDMFSKVEESIGTLKNGLVVDFMPYVMDILDWVIKNMPKIKDTVKSVMDKILPIVLPIFEKVLEWLPKIMGAIEKVLNWIMPFVEPILDGIMTAFDAFSKLFSGDLSGFLDGIWKAIKGIGGSLFNAGKEIFGQLWDGIKNIWSNISGWVSDKVNWLKDKITFWKKGQSDMKTDGSHAAGLNYVPYDGYVAELHRGEVILNSGTAQDMKTDIINGIKEALGGGIGGTIVVQSVLDGKVIGQSTAKYNKQQMRMGY